MEGKNQKERKRLRKKIEGIIKDAKAKDKGETHHRK